MTLKWKQRRLSGRDEGRVARRERWKLGDTIKLAGEGKLEGKGASKTSIKTGRKEE